MFVATAPVINPLLNEKAIALTWALARSFMKLSFQSLNYLSFTFISL
jgi:hypothetical protein